MFLTHALVPPLPSVFACASRAILLFLENDQPMLLLIVTQGRGLLIPCPSPYCRMATVSVVAKE